MAVEFCGRCAAETAGCGCCSEWWAWADELGVCQGTDAKHVLILVDGVRLNQANVSGSSDISQIPLSMVQRIEYIRGPRSAVYGSDAVGGVINILTERKTEGTTLNATMGSHGYQEYDASTQQKIGDRTTITAAGSYLYTKGFDVEANGNTGGICNLIVTVYECPVAGG